MATNLGPTEPSQTINVNVWLKLHNQAGLDALVQDLYEPGSAKYRQWLTPAQFQAEYAPTAAEARTVAQYLLANNLPVVEMGPNNMFVRAQGTIATVSRVFHVQINNYQLNGTTYFANASEPYVDESIAPLVGAVYGLQNLTYKHPYMARAPKSQNAPSGGGFQSLAAPAATSPANAFGSVCFTGATTETINPGTLPIGTYTGNIYAAKAGASGCGYTPPEIQIAYNLNALYDEGFTGGGQTIVIIDWCGSPTIRQDANTFSAAYGLPPLTPATFKILNSSTPPTCAEPDPEINIDVEWAHAIAPGAHIDLVVPPSPSFDDVDTAELYAIANGLGNVISGSYGSAELYTPTAVLIEENLINEIAAVFGMSANFATGDAGDDTFDSPFNQASVSAPADSPYATAVGGVTLALKPNSTIAWQTGWGNNETLLAEEGTVYDPPINFGFAGGSGGGPSAFFAKPPYQARLPGATRQLPDISWLADPFTGAVIVISYPFQSPVQIYTVYGGTSLATPMFSGLWAIANQEAGTPLGLAAAYLYSMPAKTITDVLPVNSATNVTASINEGNGFFDNYTASQLAAPLELTTQFYSAIWNYPLVQDTAYVLSFGTDSGLLITPGWDNVTGLGVPNGKAFADFFK
ncbi:MAG: S53 family peptidase [Bryobacteraceae bacterium]